MLKFNQYNVTDTVTKNKARVHYSLDNRVDGRDCVTIYAKDCDGALDKVMSLVALYNNDSDGMVDYFEKGHVDLFEGHPLYQVARKRAELNEKKAKAKAAKA